jgi:hypothetical protein
LLALTISTKPDLFVILRTVRLSQSVGCIGGVLYLSANAATRSCGCGVGENAEPLFVMRRLNFVERGMADANFLQVRVELVVETGFCYSQVQTKAGLPAQGYVWRLQCYGCLKLARNFLVVLKGIFSHINSS